MRADSAVEPTKSENITVTRRCSARSSGDVLWSQAFFLESAVAGTAPRFLRREVRPQPSIS